MPTITYQSNPAKSLYPFVYKDKGFVISERGFTLLELLAVVLIIGLIVSFATLSVGQKSSQDVQGEVERLNGLLRLAGEEAVMQGRELALQFSKEAYSFLELSIENEWQPVGDDPLLRERSIPPNIKLELFIEGGQASFEDKNNLPRVFILSSGEMTPFILTLGVEEEQERYSLQGSIDGKLTLTNNAENGLGV